jgi:acetyl-CoA synthetase
MAEEGDIKWFTEAKLNITKNCIDRHLNKGDKTAIIFEPNNPAEALITYTDLHQRVCKMANVLKEQGITKGDRVCIYLPMIPELAVATLACARIEQYTFCYCFCGIFTTVCVAN